MDINEALFNGGCCTSGVAPLFSLPARRNGQATFSNVAPFVVRPRWTA